MDDTIYRQDAIDALHGAIIDFFDVCDDDEESPMTYKDEQLLEINKAISGRIKQLPSAQRKKGKWKETDDGWDGTYYVCSECGCPWTLIDGTPEDNGMNYCPNCGADMRTSE